MVVEKLILGRLQTNCYIISDGEVALVVDPADEAPRIMEVLQRHKLQAVGLVATHAHFDHLLAVEEVKNKTGAPFYLHHLDEPVLEEMQVRAVELLGIQAGPPPKVDVYLEEGDRLSIGEEGFSVLHTPGHSPGGISLYDGRSNLFSGDTLFAGSIGRPDLPGGSYETLIRSIQNKLLPLPEEVAVYPGHGPTTTIGQEKRHNPFLQF
ncbi:MAG: MBL fold metallo-hydrolase [Chloroflexi bacterium]|nr:MBL fold metallo-hydrolase [Chloroflexota bacterium]